MSNRTPFRFRPAGTVTALIALVGVLDFLSGYRYTVFVFYFLPVAYAAWTNPRWFAIGAAITSAILTFFLDIWTGNPHSGFPHGYWNAVIQLLSFLTVAYGVARIHGLLLQERRLAGELQDALAEVKTLSGILPICAKCKKIRNDQGYWQQVEVYLEKHTDAHFTHGYCERCANELLAQAGLPPKFAEPPDEPDAHPKESGLAS